MYFRKPLKLLNTIKTVFILFLQVYVCIEIKYENWTMDDASPLKPGGAASDI